MSSPARIIHHRKSRNSEGLLPIFGKWIIWLVALILLAILGMAFLTGLLYVQIIKDLPPVGNMEILFTDTENGFLEPIQVFDRSHMRLFDLLHPGTAERRWLYIGDVGEDSLPEALINAMVISHDKAFWSSRGYDLGPLINAFIPHHKNGKNAELHRSITQQLIGMTILPTDDLLRSDQWRFLRETFLAQRLTKRYSKDQILEWYLNSVSFGNLAYGVDAASLLYFDKHAPELTLAECAMLAAISVESMDDPFEMPDRIRDRQAQILQAMFEQGIITELESQKASLDNVVLQEPSGAQDTDLKRYTLSRMADALGEAITNRAGLYVFTTIDSELQYKVECEVESLLFGLNGENFNSPDVTLDKQACSPSELISTFIPGNGNGVYADELASVILDAQNGEILSLFGPVDRAKPGTSILYPFVYLTAFSRGYSPGTMVLDIPVDNSGKEQFPGTVAHGPVLMRNALAGRYPFAVQRMIQMVGMENVLQVIGHMGISKFGLLMEGSRDEKFPESFEISLIDSVYGYGILANSGKMIGTPAILAAEETWRSLDPIFIREIMDQRGRTIYKAEQGEKSIVSQELAFLITDVLKQSEIRMTTVGQPDISGLDRPSAVLSGIDPSRELSWTIGYTPSRVAGVWLENQAEDGPDGSIPPNVSTGLWHVLMNLGLQTQPTEDWQKPLGVNQVEICEPSGLLPTQYCQSIVRDYFLVGTEPIQYDTFYEPFRINKETGKLATLFTPIDLVEEQIYFVPPQEATEWAHTAGYLQPPGEYDTLTVPPFDDDHIQIDIPHNFDTIRGEKWISGRTKIEGFRYFRLQYGEGLNPTYWFQIGESRYSPVVEGTLILWDTTDLDGLYALQLIVVDQDGIARIDTKYVTVDNEEPEIDLHCLDAALVVERGRGQRFSCDVSAKDNIDISKVEFYLNERRIRIDYIAPFEIVLEVDALQEGVLFARAYDLAGNVSQSESVQIAIVE